MTLDAGIALELNTDGQHDHGTMFTPDAGEQLDKANAARFARHAVTLSQTAAAVANAAGVATVDLNGPGQGRYWEVTGLVVVGADDHTVIAGTTVAFYIGNVQQASLSDLVLPGSQGGASVTVPSNAQWGRRQLQALAPDHAFVIVRGLGAGVQVVANLLGWDRDLSELPDR